MRAQVAAARAVRSSAICLDVLQSNAAVRHRFSAAAWAHRVQELTPMADVERHEDIAIVGIRLTEGTRGQEMDRSWTDLELRVIQGLATTRVLPFFGLRC